MGSRLNDTIILFTVNAVTYAILQRLIWGKKFQTYQICIYHLRMALIAKGLTKMRKIDLIWDFKCICCTKLPIILRCGVFIFAVSFLNITMVWCRWIMHTFRPAIMSGKHVDLAMVRYFYHNSIIVNWERLLPWFSINPHVCMTCRSFVKLKADSVCLTPS